MKQSSVTLLPTETSSVTGSQHEDSRDTAESSAKPCIVGDEGKCIENNTTDNDNNIIDKDKVFIPDPRSRTDDEKVKVLMK